nr:MAG: nucleocapsid [Hubei sediment phenui-like virus 1]
MVSTASIDEVGTFVSLFAYEGFNPELVHQHMMMIKNDMGISDNEFVKDMLALVTLGALKGNYTARNAAKISDEGRKKADDLYKRYKMKTGGLGGDKKAIILPRVMAAFPELTTRVIVKSPPRDFGTQTGFLPTIMKNPVFPTLVPQGMETGAAQTLLYLYTVYSADQSVAISQIKDFDACFSTQRSYVTISFNSTVPPEATRISMIKKAKEVLVEAVSKGKSLKVGEPPSMRVDAAAMRKAIDAL